MFLSRGLCIGISLQVLFVCTANVVEMIPNPLLDRMEVVAIAGYITDEKMHIARDYLEKSTREACGIKPEQVFIFSTHFRVPLPAKNEIFKIVTYNDAIFCFLFWFNWLKMLTTKTNLLQVEVTEAALLALIENYCREAGVRNLQKHIEKIYRKVCCICFRSILSKLFVTDTMKWAMVCNTVYG